MEEPEVTPFVEVTDVNVGVALSEIAGVAPPLDARFPDAVTDVTHVAQPTVGLTPPELVIGALAATAVTGVVTSAAFGTVAVVNPAPLPTNSVAV